MELKIDYLASMELDVMEIASEMSLDFNLTKEAVIAKLFARNTGLDASSILKIHDLEMPKGDFVVNEWSTGFEVEHIESGKTHWLSDGVDVLTYHYGIQEHQEVRLSPGVFGFVELWTESLNEDASTTYEAYFPELDS